MEQLEREFNSPSQLKTLTLPCQDKMMTATSCCRVTPYKIKIITPLAVHKAALVLETTTLIHQSITFSSTMSREVEKMTFD